MRTFILSYHAARDSAVNCGHVSETTVLKIVMLTYVICHSKQFCHLYNQSQKLIYFMCKFAFIAFGIFTIHKFL